jgi:hypothetical protein
MSDSAVPRGCFPLFENDRPKFPTRIELRNAATFEPNAPKRRSRRASRAPRDFVNCRSAASADDDL